MGFSVLTKCVKRFRGALLRPLPPGEQKDVRWLDVFEHDPIDEVQFASWAKQAAALPGECPRPDWFEELEQRASLLVMTALERPS